MISQLYFFEFSIISLIKGPHSYSHIDFPIFEPKTPDEVISDYKKAQMAKGPVMIVERKSCYDGKTTTI